MAPRTAGGMTHSGHTHRENYGFIGTNRPAPASVFSRSLGLHLRNLGLVAHGEHTPETAHRGRIPEYTYPEGPIPSLVTSHGQVSCLRNQRIMARDKLARGMALTGHILLGNHVVNHTKGSALVSALGHGLDLRLENLGPTDFGGRTLGAAHGGCIPEPTYVGGPGPSLITGHGQDFHPGSLMSVVHGELTRGMARDGRNTLGNHKIARTNGSMPVIGYCPIQTRHVRKLDLIVKPRTGQRFHLQNVVSQGTHEQRSRPPPCCDVTRD
jgi:hypothetical protein